MSWPWPQVASRFSGRSRTHWMHANLPSMPTRNPNEVSTNEGKRKKEVRKEKRGHGRVTTTHRLVWNTSATWGMLDMARKMTVSVHTASTLRLLCALGSIPPKSEPMMRACGRERGRQPFRGLGLGFRGTPGAPRTLRHTAGLGGCASGQHSTASTCR